MKTLSNVQIKIDGTKLTLLADIVEKDYSQFPVQQQTIAHISAKNRRHHRHIQISEAGIMVKTPGKRIGLVIEKQTLVDLATEIEPKLSYAPVATSKLDKSLTVNINSELKPDLQWEVSVDKTSTWQDIPGQTTNVLDKSKVKAGDFVRLKASSEAGSMTTNAVII